MMESLTGGGSLARQTAKANNSSSNQLELQMMGEKTKTQKSKERVSKEFQDFIGLMTTQLKHQDPTDPMKTEEFSRQVVEFAGVEQALNTNLLLEQLIENNKKAKLDEATSYVGHNVTINTQHDKLGAFANFKYHLAEDANNVTIDIRDESGKVVHTFNYDFLEKGYHEQIWDGRSIDENGEAVRFPQGEFYSIHVRAIAKDGFKMVDESEFPDLEKIGAKRLSNEKKGGKFVDISQPLVSYKVEGMVTEVKLKENGNNLLKVTNDEGFSKYYPLNQIDTLAMPKQNMVAEQLSQAINENIEKESSDSAVNQK